MKKKIITIISLLLIIFGLGSSFNSSQVQATPRANSRFWWKTRKIRLTKNIKILKSNGRVVSYKQRPVKYHLLKKGTIVKVQGDSNGWAWFFMGRIPGVGKANNHHYFWAYKKENTKWFKLIR